MPCAHWPARVAISSCETFCVNACFVPRVQISYCVRAGSGFIWDNTHIVTNFHVIKDEPWQHESLMVGHKFVSFLVESTMLPADHLPLNQGAGQSMVPKSVGAMRISQLCKDMERPFITFLKKVGQGQRSEKRITLESQVEALRL
eukprot:4376313-Amphidinium_carterae.1